MDREPNCPLEPVAPLGPRPCSPAPNPLPLLPGDPEFKETEAETEATLSSLLNQLHLHPLPPVRVAAVLAVSDATLDLPPDVLCLEDSAPAEETQTWARWAERTAGWDSVHTGTCGTHLWGVPYRRHVALAQDMALGTLGKLLCLLDRVRAEQVGHLRRASGLFGIQKSGGAVIDHAWDLLEGPLHVRLLNKPLEKGRG